MTKEDFFVVDRSGPSSFCVNGKTRYSMTGQESAPSRNYLSWS